MENKYRPQEQRLRPDQTCRLIADRQFGVLSRAQALEAGMSARAISYRLTKEEWQPFLPSVYLLSEAGGVFERRVMGACLWAGPKVDVNRTLLDLSGVLSPDELGVSLDSALRKRLTTVARLEWRLGWENERVRRGSRALRDLLVERRHQAPVESALESAFARLLRAFRDSQLPKPVTQYVITDEGQFVARVDFAFPHAKVAIEIDGFGAHMSKRAFVNDRRRDRRLQAMGWIVLRFTFEDLRHPDLIAAQIRRVLAPRLP